MTARESLPRERFLEQCTAAAGRFNVSAACFRYIVLEDYLDALDAGGYSLFNYLYSVKHQIFSLPLLHSTSSDGGSR